MMLITEEIRSLVLERAPSTELRRQAAAEGMLCLREDGWRLVRSGRTTLEEVLRVTKDERTNGSSSPHYPAAAKGGAK